MYCLYSNNLLSFRFWQLSLIGNKAVYTAALVADGWAGAENLKKQLCDRPTDGPTDGPKSGLQSRLSATKKNKAKSRVFPEAMM